MTLAVLALAGAILAAGCAVLDGARRRRLGSGPTARWPRSARARTRRSAPRPRRRSATSRLPEAVDPLLRAVRDPDPRVRRRAADALEHFEGAAARIVPVLTAAVAAEPDAAARVDMGWTLKKLKADPQAWTPAFRASLGDSDPLTRHNAAVGLAGTAPALEIFPTLFAEIGTPFGQSPLGAPAVDPAKGRRAEQRPAPHAAAGGRPQAGQQSGAARVRGAGPRPPRAPAARGHRPLAAALRDPEPDVRTNAVYTLTRLGQQPNGGPAVTPALLVALKDWSPACARRPPRRSAPWRRRRGGPSPPWWRRSATERRGPGRGRVRADGLPLAARPRGGAGALGGLRPGSGPPGPGERRARARSDGPGREGRGAALRGGLRDPDESVRAPRPRPSRRSSPGARARSDRGLVVGRRAPRLRLPGDARRRHAPAVEALHAPNRPAARELAPDRCRHAPPPFTPRMTTSSNAVTESALVQRPMRPDRSRESR